MCRHISDWKNTIVSLVVRDPNLVRRQEYRLVQQCSRAGGDRRLLDRLSNYISATELFPDYKTKPVFLYLKCI